MRRLKLQFDQVINLTRDNPSLGFKHGEHLFNTEKEFKVFLSNNLWFIDLVLTSNEWQITNTKQKEN